jgi:hypothetical protein
MDSLGIQIVQVSAVPGRRAALIAGCQAFGCATPQVFLVRLDSLAITPLIQGSPTAWALEGGRIVYVTGNGSMFVAALDVEAGTVGSPTPLPGTVTIGALGAALTVSRDGTMLYVTGGGPPTSRNFELVRLAADQEPIVIPGTTGLAMDNQSRLTVSPDGRSLLLVMATGGARAQSCRGTSLAIRSLETGDTRRFTTGGAAYIRGHGRPTVVGSSGSPTDATSTSRPGLRRPTGPVSRPSWSARRGICTMPCSHPMASGCSIAPTTTHRATGISTPAGSPETRPRFRSP